MTEKRITRIRTLDGFDNEPFVSYVKRLEEEEAELERLYPHPNKATYLKYKCHYCDGNKFYLFSPVRSKNMNPTSDGFIIIPKTSKKATTVCRSCILELSRRNEPFRMNLGGY
jgi:hypothetical protein